MLTPEIVESACHQCEVYKEFSKLTPASQEAAIKRMGLSPEDEKSFRMAMAWMKLFIDAKYRKALEKSMGEALYEYFNRKEA